jgi:hypothetical protein
MESTMAKVTLGDKGPASFTKHGYTVTRGQPRDDIPPDVAREFQHEHIKVELDHAEQAEVAQEEQDQADGKVRKPKGRRQITDAIIQAIDKLDLDNESHYTSDGKPSAVALTQILGWQVTKEDRDQALITAAQEPDPGLHAPKPNITIVKKATPELLDSGEEAVEDEDDSTGGAVTV